MENKIIPECAISTYAERLKHFNDRCEYLTELLHSHKIAEPFEFEISKVICADKTIETMLSWTYNEFYNGDGEEYIISLCIREADNNDECLTFTQYHFDNDYTVDEIDNSMKVKYSKSIDGLIDVIEKKLTLAVK